MAMVKILAVLGLAVFVGGGMDFLWRAKSKEFKDFQLKQAKAYSETLGKLPFLKYFTGWYFYMANNPRREIVYRNAGLAFIGIGILFFILGWFFMGG